MLKNVANFTWFSLLFSPKKVAGSLVKLSESIFEVFILCFQSYLCSFCTISSGLRVQFRYLLANLRKIYIHDVNVVVSQADRALNWTARINKVVERVTQEQIHIFWTKNIPSISGLPRVQHWHNSKAACPKQRFYLRNRGVQIRSETNPNPIRSDRIFSDFGSSKIISDRIG